MSISFQKSTTLQTPSAPVVKSTTFATSRDSESIPSERRWWASKFQLGPSRFRGTSKTKSTSVTFYAPSNTSSIIEHVAFAPNESGLGKKYQMAVCAGPRVSLYGGSNSSSLSRALAQNSNNSKHDTNVNNNKDGTTTTVRPDRTIGTGGNLTHCASYRDDARLLVIGCDAGYVKVCDAWSRATLRNFHHRSIGGGGYSVHTVGWLPRSVSNHANVEKKMHGMKIWSGGDDAILRIWDLGIGATSESSHRDGNIRPIATLCGHGDSIRTCVSVTLDGQKMRNKMEQRVLLATGSYDHTVRIWDVNYLHEGEGEERDHNTGDKDRCLSILDHGAPVECVLVLYPPNMEEDGGLPNQSLVPMLASAGGTIVKLWNPINGNCVSTLQTKHSKTITSMCLALIMKEGNVNDEYDHNMTGKRKNGGCVNFRRRLLTAGLDGFIRIHSIDELIDLQACNTIHNTEEGAKKQKSVSRVRKMFDLQFVHGIITPHPITSITMSPDHTRLVVGTTIGLITVRCKSKYVPQSTVKGNISDPRGGTYAYFERGANVNTNADAHVGMQLKRKKLKAYDHMLKRFQYGDALDEVLRSRDPRLVIAVLEELGRRQGLKMALSNRDEEGLEPLLAFVHSFLSMPRYSPVLIGVANILCDVYGSVFGQSDMIDECFQKIRLKVMNECVRMKTLLRLVGQIDAIMYMAELYDMDGDDSEVNEVNDFTVIDDM